MMRYILCMESRMKCDRFIASVEKNKYASRLFIVVLQQKLFLRIEYFMMGRRKHSKERRQFHFDCCTSADFQFAKLQFKRHAKITRRVNIEWDDGVNDAKIGEKKSKKKEVSRFNLKHLSTSSGEC